MKQLKRPIEITIPESSIDYSRLTLPLLIPVEGNKVIIKLEREDGTIQVISNPMKIEVAKQLVNLLFQTELYSQTS